MPIAFRSPAVRTLARPIVADDAIDASEVRALIDGVRSLRPTDAARADVLALVSRYETSLSGSDRATLLAFASGAPSDARVLTPATARLSKVRGPEEPAKVGDLVKAPEIRWSASDVVKGLRDFEASLRSDPDRKARLMNEPWPQDDAAKQLEWCLAYELADNKLEDPLWHTATNDSSAAAASFVHGVVAAHEAGVSLVKLEARVARAEAAAQQRMATDPTIFDKLSALPFPASPDAQLEWATLMQYAWTPEQNPAYLSNALARATTDLVRGLTSKRANNSEQTPVLSERRTFSVDGDERIYAVHTPPGPKPSAGWPTVVFFHGSYGGHAPEQSPTYQQLNDVADRHGYQVLYLVGAPQDRNDSRTGRGMLNWDPVGAGPGGRNDRFVHELLGSLSTSGDVDKSRVIAAGHSQGGYYVSDLLAAYPDAFAGAAIFGAGPGSIMSSLGPRGERKTPTYLFVGQDDIHKQSGDQLAKLLGSGGYGGALVYDQPAGRGHEVLTSDYERMFAVLGDEVNASTSLGASDGRTITGKDGPGGGQPGVAFRSHIDVNRPPPELQAVPWAWSLVAQLAQNPWLQLDTDVTRFSVEEWKQSLRYLHTWPPAMQQQIAALRAFFVVAPPPRDGLDLTSTASPVWADRDMARAAYLLQTEPAFDLDGYPGVLTRHEVEAALTSRAYLAADQVRGLEKLLALFGPSTGGVGTRAVTTVPPGARLELYPGSGDAQQKLERLISGLSQSPAFAKVLEGTTILVSPPGRGLEAIPELDASLADAEGVAMFEGPRGAGGPPTLAVRHDSITRWDLGAAHELCHLLLHSLGPAAMAEAGQIRESLRLPGSAPDDYANPHEMFAFFGQWYLAGHGDVVKELSPTLFAFLERHLGDARVQDPDWGEDGARAAITSLFGWFQTGRRQ